MKRRKRNLTPAMRKEQEKRWARERALSAPITERDIARFTRHLLAVPFYGLECWFYVAIGRRETIQGPLEFSTVDYATTVCNGQPVNAHRFALAAHLGVSYLSLAGRDIHHIKGC